jgi:uncharacterized membrane protein (UPF0127 family)
VSFLSRIAPVALFFVIAGCQSSPVNGAEAAKLALAPLEITTAKGKIAFTVEVARTPEEQARGLMFRTSLPEFGGMIFPMVPPREASFWMKDTVIPLDMIFIRSDGTIARIAANTIPYDLTPVSSGESVVAVLEIAGGRAEALGIAENDRVIWK